ncbi:hypothetical protein KC573_04640, partial [candidate division WWE3 bacterium]|nr:hypothetical protein [candidate division WWE3 bacterium]
RLVDYRRVTSGDTNFQEEWQLIRSAATEDMVMEEFELRADNTLDFSITTTSLTNAVNFLLTLKNSEALSNFSVLEINYHKTSDRYYFETRVKLT